MNVIEDWQEKGPLSKFCRLVNTVVRDDCDGDKDTCILSALTVCDVLNSLGISISPIRVEAAVYPDDTNAPGVILGRIPNGDSPRKKASPDHWHGHLASIACGHYLIDTTLDQIEIPNVITYPCVVDLIKTLWFKEAKWETWTGLLRYSENSVLRYTKFPRQNGWKSAPDYRLSHRIRLVEIIAALAKKKIPDLWP